MVSNRALAVMLIAAIMISIGGTMASISMISRIRLASITGSDILNSKSSVDVQVGSFSAIDISVSKIDFGNGTVAPGCQNCTMHTPGVNDTPDCCIGFKVPLSSMVLENIGNKNVSINMSVSQGASDMIGGTGPLFDYNITQNETGSCNESTNFGTWIAHSSGEKFICPLLFPDFTKDEIKMHTRIRIPDDSKKGVLNASFNFTATTVT